MVVPRTYPVNLVVAGKACLVVGGGSVAARKVAGLAAGGAHVSVVAPHVIAGIDVLAAEVHRRRYRPGEARAYRLVVTATGIPHLDAQVAADAEAGGIWVNSADDPGNCTFLLPALHRDGPVTVAVSTGGASPALATWLRDAIGAALGEGVGALATLLAEARSRLHAAGRSTETVRWQDLLDDGLLLDLVRKGQLDEARRALTRAGCEPGEPSQATRASRSNPATDRFGRRAHPALRAAGPGRPIGPGRGEAPR